MRTLAQILADEADQMIKSAEVIKKLIEVSKESGMYWPEIDEETGAMEGTEIIDGKRYRTVDATNGCVGCIFNGADGCNKPAVKCYGHQRTDRRSVIFKYL